MIPPRRVHRHAFVLIALAFATGCQEPATSNPSILSADASPDVPGGEEELFGEIFENGAPTTATNHYVILAPAGAATLGRLHLHQSSDDEMWANPAAVHMFGWFDPAGGGGCGSLTTYVQNDSSKREAEIHSPGPGQQPAGKERHCIRPGTYDFSGNTAFRLDYLQLATTQLGASVAVNNGTAGVTEYLENPTYEERFSAFDWFDLVLNRDLTPGTWQDTLVLDIDNSLGNPTTSVFTNDDHPSGTENDWFRFSVARSSSTWNLRSQGRFLARVYFDFDRSKSHSTNYFDPRGSGHVMRHHRFASHVDQSRTAVVALEIMRPDEEPDDTVNVATRSVQITRTTPWPCATLEAATTWTMTDQRFNASCSTRGPTIRYRWHFGAGFNWTPYSADTLYDFAGHATSGPQNVVLQVLNTSSGLSSTTPQPVTVNPGVVSIDGPTYIMSKQVNWYHSNISGYWFERWDPDPRWYSASSTPRDSLGRIWYAGDYTVDLRHQDSTVIQLKRGRLHIVVCISHPEECIPLAASAHRSGVGSDAVMSWGLFGGGPWLSWGSAAAPTVARLYDLLGMHDDDSPFTRATWLDSAGNGAFARAPIGLSWQAHPLGLADTRAYTFTVTSPGDRPFVFGFALDPDLGGNPADDVTGYDAGRGLVYVYDGERAIGYLLRDRAGTNALVSIQQFGLRRWAPTLDGDAWAAQRAQGVHLLPGASDAQFVLSAAQASTGGAWTFVIVRAPTVAALRTKADSAIEALSR